MPMGLEMRYNVRSAQHFVRQLSAMDLHTGCLQTALRAMGAPVHLHDAIDQAEHKLTPERAVGYFAQYGLELNGTYELALPVSVGEMRRRLGAPIAELAALDHTVHGKRLAGLLFYIGSREDNQPHVIGVLPRDYLPRDVRKRLHRIDAHLVVDTSFGRTPVYSMTTRNITDNVNEFLVHNIPVSLGVVTRLEHYRR